MQRITGSWLAYAIVGFLMGGCLISLLSCFIFYLSNQAPARPSRADETSIISSRPQVTSPEPTIQTATPPAFDLFEQAERYMARGEPEKVRSLLFPRLGEIQTDKDLAQAYELMGQAEVAQGHFLIAAGLFESMVSYQPSAENLFLLASAYDIGGDLKHAQEKYEQLLALDEPDGETYREIAEARSQDLKDILSRRYPPGTFAPIISPTATAIPIMTWTPLPTLTSKEAQERVHELLLNNAGCEFPCWWGIIPGKTNWPEAYHFLASFVDVTPFVAENNTTGEPTYLIQYPLPNERGGGFSIDVKNNQISIIFVGEDLTKQNSPLHQVLTIYGIPDNVYIRTFEEVPGDDFPLTLVLSFIRNNFVVAYDMIAHAKNGELISCANGESPGLWIWSPDEIVTERRIQDWTLGAVPFTPLKPLEQVTNLDLESFTDVFSRPGSSNCLSTNKKYWEIVP